MDVRVGAYGVIVRGGRMLLSHWNEKGSTAWTLPGGGLEGGETCAQAAVREIGEETGYLASVTALLGVDSEFFGAGDRIWENSRPLHSLRVIYRARVIGGELANEIGGTTDEARWIPLGAINDLPLTSLVEVALKMSTR